MRLKLATCLIVLGPAARVSGQVLDLRPYRTSRRITRWAWESLRENDDVVLRMSYGMPKAATLCNRPRLLDSSPSGAVRVIDAGSCAGCELAVNVLPNPCCDIVGLDIPLVVRLCQAASLPVTGPVTRPMELALSRTHDAVPDSKLVVAVGDRVRGCGVHSGGHAVCGRVVDALPMDVTVYGRPPRPQTLPQSILHGCHSTVSQAAMG